MTQLIWTDEDMLMALHLYDHEGLTYDQIAARFGRTKGAIAGLMSRIRNDTAGDNGTGDGTMRPMWWKR